jgi:hypothetical protein
MTPMRDALSPISGGSFLLVSVFDLRFRHLARHYGRSTNHASVFSYAQVSV